MRWPDALILATAALVSSTALASPDGNGFGSARLAGGDPPFIGCLNSPTCSDDFFKFLNQATLEQGFAMQGAAPISSSVVNRRNGWIVGGLLHTFPFAPPRKNLSGKTENTQFSPVLPKLAAARLWDAGDAHIGLGMTALPPIPVQGAAALILGLDASMAWNMGDSPHRCGMEADFTFVRASAPVAASKEQFDDREGYSEGHLSEDKYMSNCDPEKGCIDVFTVVDFEIRSRVSWAVADVLFPYAAVGLMVVNQGLHVEYDDTRWKLFALQPTMHGGAAWAPADPVLLSLGLDLGLKQGNQSPEGVGAFYRIEAAAGVRL
jgi:hypothetical protein